MPYEHALDSSSDTTLAEPRSRYRRTGATLPRLLLVEADAQSRDASTRSLARAFQVTAVGSAEEALGCFRRGAFELVLTDFRMASMTGLELLEQVRVLEPRVRRVLMSQSEIPGLAGHIASGVVDNVVQRAAELLALAGS
jgi:DNA-binding NtrC family response regulator